MTRRRRRLLCLTLILVVILLPASWFAYLMVRIGAYASVRSTVEADAAIVLGNAVLRDGRPGPVLEGRLEHAVALYKAGRVKTIIFTGGVRYAPDLTESSAARDYALTHGVRAEDAYIETVSQTTWQNLREARKLTREHGLGRVLIVSDPLHMRRAMTMARDLGLDAHPSPTATSRVGADRGTFRFHVREAFFYAGYLLRRTFGG